MLDRIILGTVQFGQSYGINNSQGKLSKEEVFQTLDLAHSAGITTLDTAAAYGSAIELIGSYFHSRDSRFDIITKVHSESKKPGLISTFQESLEKLEIPCVNTLMFHRSADLDEWSNLGQMLKLKEMGLAKNIGISIYDLQDFDSSRFSAEIDIVQLPFNILDSSEKKRDALRKVSENYEVHARSVFLQGLFFKQLASFPSHLAPLRQWVERIQHIASEEHFDISGLAAAYVLSKEYISKIVIGVDNCAQLEISLREISKCNLSKKLIEEMDQMECANAQMLDPRNWNR